MNTVFECPKCKKRFERNSHYYKILEGQNFISVISGGAEVKDMCMSCGYIQDRLSED